MMYTARQMYGEQLRARKAALVSAAAAAAARALPKPRPMPSGLEKAEALEAEPSAAAQPGAEPCAPTSPEEASKLLEEPFAMDVGCAASHGVEARPQSARSSSTAQERPSPLGQVRDWASLGDAAAFAVADARRRKLDSYLYPTQPSAPLPCAVFCTPTCSATRRDPGDTTICRGFLKRATVPLSGMKTLPWIQLARPHSETPLGLQLLLQ